jgi:hypothetical protein
MTITTLLTDEELMRALRYAYRQGAYDYALRLEARRTKKRNDRQARDGGHRQRALAAPAPAVSRIAAGCCVS